MLLCQKINISENVLHKKSACKPCTHSLLYLYISNQFETKSIVFRNL